METKVFEGDGFTVVVVSDPQEVTRALMSALDLTRATEKIVRSSPEIEVAPIPPSVVQSQTSEPVCQECGDVIAPLTVDDAKELYGIQVCVPCGKMLT